MPRLPMVRCYRDLIAWQKAMDLVTEVYGCTQAFPKTEVFGLVSQLRRAAVSIPSNIAEGHARQSTGEFRQFWATRSDLWSRWRRRFSSASICVTLIRKRRTN